MKATVTALAISTFALAGCGAATAPTVTITATPKQTSTATPATEATPGLTSVAGTLTLKGSDNTEDTGYGCQGTGGYDDITKGAQVLITDQSATTLGLGQLSAGIKMGTDCKFTFTVDNIPTNKSFYSVKITHRSGPSYTLADLQGGLDLSLGD